LTTPGIYNSDGLCTASDQQRRVWATDGLHFHYKPGALGHTF